MSEMEIQDIITELRELVRHAEEALQHYNDMCRQLPSRKVMDTVSPGLGAAITDLKYANRDVRYGLHSLIREIQNGKEDDV